jgi:spore maturation protein CgeB
MNQQALNITVIGLSITSSWGNGHATTFRALIKELNKAGHQVTFLERDVPWYATSRDLPAAGFCRLILYQDLEELKEQHLEKIKSADLVIVGSYVPDGVAVGEFVCREASGIKAFYDIDTPVTLAKLARKDYEYLSPDLIPRFDLYLSFTGGPTLNLLEDKYGSPCARALYCSVDSELYYPEPAEQLYDLGYLGTFSSDRQPPLEKLLFEAARLLPESKFAVAGSLYPDSTEWPSNVLHIEHLAPVEHRRFYNSQRFTLNITRQDMLKSGYSPSVRLFEAAACGVPIISDYWEGLETIFDIGTDVLISNSGEETVAYLQDMNEKDRIETGLSARKKILTNHTAAHRASELVNYALELKGALRA